MFVKAVEEEKEKHLFLKYNNMLRWLINSGVTLYFLLSCI